MIASPGSRDSSEQAGVGYPSQEVPNAADSGCAECADAMPNGAEAVGHRLHKPGVAGSSPAAATCLFDEPLDAYHSDAEWWSKSQLWDLLIHGPAFFHARHLARTVQPYSGDASLRKGTLVHEWAEQGDSAWWSRVAIIPDDALGSSGRRTKKTDEWVASQRPDAILLKQGEADEYRRQFDAILANPIFEQLSSATTLREVSIRWVDAGTGLQLKCRPDALTDSLIWDIKTTREQDPLRTFWKSVVQYGYDFQAAHYLEGAYAAEIRADNFVFLISSTVPPYQCHAVTLPQRMLDAARRRRQACLNDLHARLTFDHWLPEDSGQVTELFVPERFMEE